MFSNVQRRVSRQSHYKEEQPSGQVRIDHRQLPRRQPDGRRSQVVAPAATAAEVGSAKIPPTETEVEAFATATGMMGGGKKKAIAGQIELMDCD